MALSAPLQRIAELADLAIASPAANDIVTVTGLDPVLPSRFRLGEVAAAALAEVGYGAAMLSRAAGGPAANVATSAVAGACAVISFGLQRVNDEVVPRTNQSNPFVRPYQCGDGRWIYLHGGFPHLAAGLADLLGVAHDADRATLAAAASAWTAIDLEAEIGERNLCGIAIRTTDEWLAHPHGEVVRSLPTVQRTECDGEVPWQPSASAQPLAGLRVLDLTRVLAGPTCGRTLAALGADVLQVTAPNTPSVPSFVIDTGHGKRRAFADFRNAEELAQVRALASKAHVVVQGYRPGVIERHGLDEASLRNAGWRGVYGSISCFGPLGPFSHRAGWEQLAQSVSGIALAEGARNGKPALVPAAATDYTTGLLMAGAIVRTLVERQPSSIVASLCQAAMLLIDAGDDLDPAEASGIGEPQLLATPGEFGDVDHLPLGVTVEHLDLGWRHSSHRLGSDELRFVS